MGQENRSSTAKRAYSRELRERAIRLVSETIQEEGASHGVVTRVAAQLGVEPNTLRSWIRRAGQGNPRDAAVAGLEVRVARLERENRELRRANEILKAASAFFAAELDRPEHR